MVLIAIHNLGSLGPELELRHGSPPKNHRRPYTTADDCRRDHTRAKY